MPTVIPGCFCKSWTYNMNTFFFFNVGHHWRSMFATEQEKKILKSVLELFSLWSAVSQFSSVGLMSTRCDQSQGKYLAGARESRVIQEAQDVMGSLHWDKWLQPSDKTKQSTDVFIQRGNLFTMFMYTKSLYVHFKHITILFANYSSIKLGKNTLQSHHWLFSPSGPGIRWNAFFRYMNCRPHLIQCWGHQSFDSSPDSDHSLPVPEERPVPQEEELWLTVCPGADAFSSAGPTWTCFWVQPSLTTSPTAVFVGPPSSNGKAQERAADLNPKTSASIPCVKNLRNQRYQSYLRGGGPGVYKHTIP